MQRTPSSFVERRADRRHPLTGFARLVPVGGGAEWYGGIVDVSARGVRLRVRPGVEVPDAARCHVHLEVAMPTGTSHTPPVRLSGDAVVLRRTVQADRAEEVALRFEMPLRVGDAFMPAPPGAGRPTVAV